MARRTLKGLSCDAIDETSIRFDWSASEYDHDGDSEKNDAWQSWEASECDACGAVLVFDGSGGDESHRNLADQHDDDEQRDKARECEGWVGLASGPVMSFYWPCAFRMDERDAAEAIADLPLCVVKVNGDTGLALTGGGMDLSWEIAEAFMRVGMLPPTALELPMMAGRGRSSARWVIAGMRQSYRVKAQWMANSLRKLRDLAKWQTKQEQEHKARKVAQ